MGSLENLKRPSSNLVRGIGAVRARYDGGGTIQAGLPQSPVQNNSGSSPSTQSVVSGSPSPSSTSQTENLPSSTSVGSGLGQTSFVDYGSPQRPEAVAQSGQSTVGGIGSSPPTEIKTLDEARQYLAATGEPLPSDYQWGGNTNHNVSPQDLQYDSDLKGLIDDKGYVPNPETANNKAPPGQSTVAGSGLGKESPIKVDYTKQEGDWNFEHPTYPNENPRRSD